MEQHTIFILTIVVIIVIFVFLLWGIINVKDNFTNTEFKSLDTIVPQNMKYKCYKGRVKGTNLTNIDTIETNRFPIEIEQPQNWFNTQ